MTEQELAELRKQYADYLEKLGVKIEAPKANSIEITLPTNWGQPPTESSQNN